MHLKSNSGHLDETTSKAELVLLLDADPERASALRRGLEDSGYRLALKMKDSGQLLKQVEAHQPDILVIGTDAPDQALLQQLQLIRDYCPKPVIMFAEKEAPKLIRQVVASGVNAFVVNDIQPHRLSSIINIASARFKETLSLRQELETTRTKLADRKKVDRAKGMLMSNQGLSEEEAYRMLRKMAMDKGQPLAAVADSVIDVVAMLGAAKI
ncbi:ANTAR domain-containing protein [Aestuariicella hydrocarbonica]|uniref:ANTAR domain-containing protein n=2 Tax=Pseudomaricurvus hydrocarbonicus TaxID=1470433 RepID=A0A9E5JXX3_9GAMM|nr:ANTAR domain-containing protein [Aestuariicella hydrocarbonica]